MKTKFGPNKDLNERTKQIDKETYVKMYTKNSYNETTINKKCNKYVDAYQKGFGIPITGIEDKGNEVHLYMKSGLKLKDALKYNELSKNQMIKEIDNLHEKLKENKIAHCDIKEDNLVVYDKKVKTIDNGEISEFNEIREVFTPHENITTFHPINKKGRTVNENTDLRGIKNVKNKIQNYKDPKFTNISKNVILGELQNKNYILKENLTKKKISNYEFANESLKVGIPVKKVNGEKIKMKYGLDLNNAIGKNNFSVHKTLNKINQIEQTLIKNKYAHTKMGYKNVVYSEKDKKIYTIDNGNLEKYNDKINEKTDKKGFNDVRNKVLEKTNLRKG